MTVTANKAGGAAAGVRRRRSRLCPRPLLSCAAVKLVLQRRHRVSMQRPQRTGGLARKPRGAAHKHAACRAACRAAAELRRSTGWLFAARADCGAHGAGGRLLRLFRALGAVVAVRNLAAQLAKPRATPRPVQWRWRVDANVSHGSKACGAHGVRYLAHVQAESVQIGAGGAAVGSS